MKRCQECLSTVEETDACCPQCGASFTPANKNRTWMVVGSVLILAGAGWYALRELGPETPIGPSNAAPQHPNRQAETAVPKQRKPEAKPVVKGRTLHHLRLLPDRGGTLFGLLIEGRHSLIFLPLDDLPLRGALNVADQALTIRVATYDKARGYALLTTDGLLPTGSSPLPLGNLAAVVVGTPLQAIDSSGTDLGSMTIQTQNASGEFSLTGSAPRGSALLDQSGAAVAYSLGGGKAISLAGLTPWLDHIGGRSLSDVQAELRASDPNMVLQAARDYLEKGLSGAAIDALRDGVALARDPQTVLAFATLERRALQIRLRELAAEDSVQAIQLAREALILYPDHYALLTDTIQIMALRGDPQEAIRYYRQLQMGSLEHAKATAQTLIKSLLSRARQFKVDGQFQESLELLSRANEIMPGRAALLISFADALSSAGQHSRAQAAAEQAASLDPAYQRSLAKYRRPAMPSSHSSRVEIPFDPKTNVIRATVRVGDLPLELIVDTGATMTIVPLSLAMQLKLIDQQNQRIQVQTASGMAEGVLVRLPELRIGALRIENLRAIAMDLPNSLSGKGLLGMNAMRRLQVRIDSERGRLILERKR